MSAAPHLAPGTRVRHYGQQYPSAYTHGTGTLAAVKGPYRVDSWAYLIYHDAGFSGVGEPRQPSWWSSLATYAVESAASSGETR